VTVAGFSCLKHVQPPPCTNTSYAYRNVKPLPKMAAQFLRKPVGAGRQKIEVLGHAWLVPIGIHGLRAEDDHIVTPPQEFQHGLLQSGQR